MALPTSVSSSSWVHESPVSGKSSGEPSSDALGTTKVISTTISTTPAPEALEFLSLLSGSDGPAHATYAAVAQRDFTESLCEVNKSVDYPDVTYTARKETKGDMVVSIPLSSAMTTTLSNSSTDAFKENSSLSSVGCKVTAAHQESKMTTVMDSLPLSPEEANVEEMCHKDIMPVPASSAGKIHDAENDGVLQEKRRESLKESFIDKYSSSSWSTSTETNFDCENGSCDGTEMKCRLCGKIVPKLQKTGITSLPRGCHNSDMNSAICNGPFWKSCNTSGENRNLNLGGRFVHPRLPGLVPSFRKHIGPRYFSALLSSSNRTLKKKSNRRSSVDVLYGREPTEPDIVKIKAKRRLSRQHDVSSIELMTLTEGNENDDSSSKSKDTNNPEEFSCRKITFHQIPVSVSPLGRATPCRELVADSSTDSCPRAPWNSLETNPSSQDLDDRFVNDTECSIDCNYGEGPLGKEEELDYQDTQEDDSEGLETSEKAAENDGRKDTVEEDGEVDAEEPSEEEHPDSARAVRKKEKQTLKKKKKRKNNYNRVKGNVRPNVMDLGNWTTELLIMLALLVYMACKALKFLETFFPAPQKKKKK